MPRITFDLDVLRTFVTGIELGNFAMAAKRLGRSTSAVSTQMKNLEEKLGTSLLRKSGRNLIPTDIGEIMLAYARRLLDLNDEAVRAIGDVHLEGRVRIGLQQELGEGMLTKIIGDFVNTHPRVHLEVLLKGNCELINLVKKGQVDLAVAWRSEEDTSYSLHLAEPSMCWIGAEDIPDFGSSKDHALPLVMAESGCPMRTAALDALDRAGIPWRIAFTSPSLSGIWSAVRARIGITVRTHLGLPKYLRIYNGLPQLPTIGLILHHAEAKPREAARCLSRIISEELQIILGGEALQDEKVRKG